MSSPGGPVESATCLVALGRDDAVRVDDELIVALDARIHRLNRTAMLIWDGCDGATPMDSLIRRLAADHGVPDGVVAADVERVLTELGELGLVSRGPVAPAAIPRIEPPVACSGCGPGPTFARHVLVVVDRAVLAVGTDAAFGAALAVALTDRVLDVLDDPVDRAAYGVVLPGAGRVGGVQDVPCLYRGPDLLARSRRPEVVVRALLTQIGIHALPDGLTLLEAVSVGRGDTVVLLPAPPDPVGFEREAARLGLAVSGVSLASLDRSGHAIVGAPWLDADLLRLDAAVADRGHVGAEPSVLPWGRYEVVGVAASAPAAGRVFGELGPTAPLGAGGRAVEVVRALCAAVPIIANDLTAVAALLRDRTTG